MVLTVFNSVAPLLQKGVELVGQKAADKQSGERLLFWLVEEVRFNLDILAAWKKEQKFELDGPRAYRICQQLRIEVASCLLSDATQSKLLMQALGTSKCTALQQLIPTKDRGADSSAQDAILWIVRKVSVLQVLTAPDASGRDLYPKEFRFGVRVKNIDTKFRELYKILTR